MMFLAHSLLLCLAVGYAAAQTGTLCPAVPNREKCVCQHKDGIIDLTPLANRDSPRYTGLLDVNDFVYSFNPCYAYTTPGDCSNVHVCQSVLTDPSTTYDIADAGTEAMYTDIDGTPYIYYTGPTLRETFVYLHCDESVKDASVTTEGDSDPATYLVYRFDIVSCHACPGSPCGSGTGGGGAAAGVAGIILMLLLVIGLVTYFVVGAVIMRVKYQATGSDIIPNKAFWIALPGLIKEGFVFTFGPPFRFIRAKVRGEQGYVAQKDSI